jgi:hypothetical protein
MLQNDNYASFGIGTCISLSTLLFCFGFEFVVCQITSSICRCLSVANDVQLFISKSEQQIPQCRNNKYRSVGTFPNFNRKTVQRAKLDTFSTHMYNCSHTWISIGTSIKIGGFKLVLWVQTSPFNKKINAVMQVFSTCE